MAGFGSRLAHAWNAFVDEEPQQRIRAYPDIGPSSGSRPDRSRFRVTNERSIISSIYTRLAIDISSVDIRHARLDENERYIADIPSNLNDCLRVEANIDQNSQDLLIDLALTLFDKGVAAVIPIDTTLNPALSGGYDIKTMRIGDVVQWYPQQVRVSVYNEKIGRRQELTLDKSYVAIVTNPLYSVMNEPNSTLQRLARKLSLLDDVDEQASSGKLDMIIQLPYVIKSETRRQQAEQRRADIEFQLKGSKYGIAYTDGTEKITQLNRPVENNLLDEVQYLTNLLFGQLGLTPEIMNGTADEATMLNYTNRTLAPILTAIVQEMKRKFLTKTARSQLQSILYFRDPFKLTPISDLAEIADKFTRNEILSSNEIRQIIGFKPHSDPKADQLINSNMPQSVTGAAPAEDTSSSDEASVDQSTNPGVQGDVYYPSEDNTIEDETEDQPDEAETSAENDLNQMSSDFDAQVDKILGG